MFARNALYTCNVFVIFLLFFIFTKFLFSKIEHFDHFFTKEKKNSISNSTNGSLLGQILDFLYFKHNAKLKNSHSIFI